MVDFNVDDSSIESGTSSVLPDDKSQRMVDEDPTGSSTRDETESNSDKSAGESQMLGQDDTRLVRKSKALVGLFLLLAATVGSVLTYKFLEQEDNLAMEKQFEVEAKEVLAVASLNARHIFNLFKAEALQITNHAVSSGQQWPFVTLPHFEAEMALLINQSKAGQFVSVQPLVLESQRDDWEIYSRNNLTWLQESIDYYGMDANEISTNVCKGISMQMGACVTETRKADPYYAPIWQVAPVPGENTALINYNTLNSKYFSRSFDRLFQSNHAVLSEATNLDDSSNNFPTSFLSTPIHQSSDESSPIVAILTAVIPWHDYFLNVLPEGAGGILVVVKNEIHNFTFRIDGPDVIYLGPQDLHDPKYDEIEISADLASLLEGTNETFGYDLNAYPTQDFEDEHTTNHPTVYTGVVVAVFALTASVFVLYDIFVILRHRRVLGTAKKSSAIINSLFPANIRDRLMEEATKDRKAKIDKAKTFTTGGSGGAMVGPHPIGGSKPIADLFSAVTVMFADISGFTAWSSTREPSQVFFLLESIYNAFDKLAKRMKVFKVETIGDSYVAVAGLPNPRNDHAEVMARFAHRCLLKMSSLVHNLEVSLGPGTASLSMRFGLHSGPVTAGVLRGEKSRFQLFGDTVNMAARMESTGLRNRVQMSKETCDLLVAAGKEGWVRARANPVHVKGKGELKTWWLVLGAHSGSTASSKVSSDEGLEGEQNAEMLLKYASETALTSGTSASFGRQNPATQRLILWNVDNLLVSIQKLLAMRSTQKVMDKETWRKLSLDSVPGRTALDESRDIINLLELPAPIVVAEKIKVDEGVVKQLVHLVSTISAMYKNHDFHNFAHASHVTQSVSKLLNRVVSPDVINFEEMRYARGKGKQDFSRCIATDPLVQFAVVFSALIHDVDHPGVPNNQLVKECDDMAKTYGNKSVAEQNSVDLAWNLLMEPQYEDLRRCLYNSQEELERLRQLIVNCVVATDVVDKELGVMRRERWERAFGSASNMDTPFESSRERSNRKGTIVLEHMIQASDISHTQQHWQIYIHWNERLFRESYSAFKAGRAENNPADSWYQGELNFFDFYVIPLAKKLKDCGVFGVSGDEYMTYAIQNRNEWANRGHQIVASYLDNLGEE